MRIRRVASLVGLIVFFMGCSMILSVIVALIHKDGSAGALLASSAIAITLGLGLFLSQRGYHKGELSLKDGFGIVGFSWISASLVGALPFLLSGAIPDFAMAFFESASGLTTTGSTILENIEAVPKGVLFWRSFIQWLGGMGIIVLSVAILPYLGLGGMQLYKAETPGPTKDKLRPRIQQTAKLLWGVYLLISILCFILLSLAGMDWYDASCHSFTTVSTGGFSPYNASLAHFYSPTIEYIVMFFMFICGISFSLHYRALSGHAKGYFSTQEVRFYVVLILVATFVIYLSRLDEQIPFEENLRETLFQVITVITSTGFGTADFEQWKPVAQLILLGLMVVGGCAGSTAGGLKVVRILLIGKYLKNTLSQQLHPAGIFVIKLDGIRVKREVIQNILGLFMVFVCIIGLSTFVLTLYGVDLVSAVTAALTCVSNIGPGLGEVGPTDNFAGIPTPGLWVLSLCMIMGRLEIFSLLILFLPETWRR